MEDISLDFSAGCDVGMSFEADLSFQCDLGAGSDTSFLDGVDLGQGQLPGANRHLARLLGTSRAVGTSLGGAVIARPAVPAAVQTGRPSTGQVVQYSTTTVGNPGYQAQPGYHAQAVTFQPPVYNGTATVISTQNAVPLQTVQPVHNGLPVQTVQLGPAVINMGIAGVQRPATGPVVVAPPPPHNWMGLSIFSVIFFTLPFGLVALLFSYQVNESVRRGDYERAMKNSNIAKWMNVLAIISGCTLYGFILLLIVAL